MSFNISGWSIRRPIPTLVLFLVLTLGGLLSFGQLGIDSNPNIDFPAVTVTVTQQGAGPEELETQVTKKVEDAVAGLGNIDDIISTVRDGSSNTIINFTLGTDIDRATNDVRDAVTRIRQDLPASIQEPRVQRLEFESGAILTYAVDSNGRSVEELSDLVDRTISQEIFDGHRGVARVERIGGVDPEVRVDLDPEQLDALGITATQVNEQIRALNVNLPSGRATLGDQEKTIRTLGSADTVDALASYRIVLPSGNTVPLSTLGTVRQDYGEIRQSAFFNGEPVVAFQVFRSTGSILVTVEEGVTAAVARLDETLPEDIEFEQIFTRADEIRDSYQSSIDALIVGCILAVVVVGFFLRDWRTTLITATALPLSIIPTFLVAAVIRLHPQQHDPAGPHPGGGEPGRRCHRGNRKRRTPYPHGQAPLQSGSGLDPGSGPGGADHNRNHRGGVPAGGIHGRHSWAVLQTLRRHGGYGHLLLDPGGATDHADDGGLSAETQSLPLFLLMASVLPSRMATATALEMDSSLRQII